VRYGYLGAVVAAWPAPALVGSYELLMWLVRTAAGGTANGNVDRRAGQVAAQSAAPSDVTGAPRRSASRPPQRRTGQTARKGQAEALVVLAAEPQMSIAELARRLGTSERTAGRIKSRLASDD
jgi:transcriptional regulator GlxA family with amidase domain